MGSTTDYFEIATDEGLFRIGDTAPDGTVETDLGANVEVTVESYKQAGDWVDIRLSGGYVLSLPETRVKYILTRDPAAA
ncbi:hypothetical protein ACJ6WF_17085 [Streptomyces sp. MMS24-I2-30]|uniref:hypothetical protein n=1 Tax=Streptomyces sp. MMS24-I2-30 TaxID=3351564 RepID=UPI003896D46F